MVTFKEVYGLFLSNNHITFSGLACLIGILLFGLIIPDNFLYKIMFSFLICSCYLFGYFIGRLSEKYKGE